MDQMPWISNTRWFFSKPLAQRYLKAAVRGLKGGALYFCILWVIAIVCRYILGSTSWFAYRSSWLVIQYFDLCARLLFRLLSLWRWADKPILTESLQFAEDLTDVICSISIATLLHSIRRTALPLAIHLTTPLPYLACFAAIALVLIFEFAPKSNEDVNAFTTVFEVAQGLYHAFRRIDNRAVEWRNSTRAALVGTGIYIILFIRIYIGVLLKMSMDNPQDEELRRGRLPFIYAKLPAAEKSSKIRLLRSKPRTLYQSIVLDDGPIEFEIFTVSLDEAPPFEAISYTWGSSVREREIVVNNQCLAVTLNAFSVLQQRGSYWRPRILWIDSVCINQDDIEEKNSQVRLMGDIYRKASRTVAWLGDEPEGFNAIVILYSLWFLLNFHATLADSMSHIQLSYLNYPAMWSSLSKLVRHPWFSRVWVVQEVVVSKTVHVIYGNTYIDWEQLSIVLGAMRGDISVSLLSGDDDFMRKINDPYSYLASIECVSHMRDLRQSYHSGEPLCMVDVIPAAGNRASDDRDRIYGLLAMPSQLSDQLKQPDYTKSTLQVYIEAGKHITTFADPLGLLPNAGIGYERKLNDLPSWIPDWTCLPNINTISVMIRETQSTDYIKEKFYSSSKSVFQIELHDEANAISLKGFIADTIATLGDSVIGRDESVNLDFDTVKCMEYLGECCTNAMHLVKREISSVYRNGQPRREAFWRTLITDRVRSEPQFRPASDIYGSYFENFMKANSKVNDKEAEPWVQALREINQDQEKWSEKQALGQGPTNEDSMEYIQLFQQVQKYSAALARGRKFCVTAKKLMGLVPPSSRPGDLVCIFYGCQAPFVIRPVHELGGHAGSSTRPAYHIVGESYFHGIMDGEMMKEEGVSEQLFYIV